MSSAKDWLFTQLGPPNHTLQLSGYAAPFGRQRQKPVVTDAIKVRSNTVYYPGSDGPPTRHIFGVKYEPWELSGRFMDQWGGQGYAKTQADFVKQFVRDQQPVAIQWGDILTARGLLESFEPARESEQQIAWKLIVLIDEDASAAPPRTQPSVPTPRQIINSLVDLKPLKLDLPIKPSILDAIDNLVGSFNSAIANVTNIANQIDSFEKALAGDIKRLRAGIGQLRTAALSYRNTIAALNADLALTRRSASTDITGLGSIADADIATNAALGKLAALEKQAEIAERGKASTSYVAQMGDTWESLSIRFYNAPDKAQKLRDANGARYGTQPEPGRSYKVPFS